MNERMTELYRQAHVPCTMIDPSNNMPVPWKEFSAEKFSELIVRECANFVENIFDDDGGHAPCEDYAKGIKKHFGVEE